MTAAALEVVRLPLAELVPDPDNPKLHGERSLAAIKASLAEFGQVEPLVVRASDRRVIGGNGRLEAMRALGWEHADCALIEVDDARARALSVALNRTAEFGVYDVARLEAILDEAGRESLFSSSLLGWTAKEVDELLRAAGGGAKPIVEASIPEPPVEPVSRRGDLWELGAHRLLCGDSTNADDVARSLDGAEPFLMVTDSPYGVNYDPAWRQRAAAEGHLAYAARRVGEVKNDDRGDWRVVWEHFVRAGGAVAYCWHASWFVGGTQRDLEEAGLTIRALILWSKPHFPISRGHYHWRHESCWYAFVDGKSARWAGGREQTTVWEVALDKNVDGGHSTQKPLELMERPIRNHGAPGDVVWDPFLGSGTTMIACERTGRRGRFLEIDPKYADCSVRRWEKASGQLAILDGQTMAQVAATRGVELPVETKVRDEAPVPG